MTLGERIQALRKDRGLSQEELGEKLGVARQSVSKWESDATIPELDKLIAMSRFFGISVGALLGIEESGEVDHELTDRELAALEAIAQKLAQAKPEAPRQEEPSKKRRRWGPAAVALIVLGGALMLLSRINRLENQLGSLQYNVSSIQNTVSREIGSISSQVRDILEEQNSVVAGKDYEILRMDLLSNEVTFLLTATPREYREGMTAEFTAQYRSGRHGSLTIPGTLASGQTFTAELTCPLTDDIILSVGFVTDGTTVTQQLGQERYLWSNTQVDVGGSLGWSVSGTGENLRVSALSADVWQAFSVEYKTVEGWQEVSLVKGTLRLWKEDKLIWSDEPKESSEDRKWAGSYDVKIPTEDLTLATGERLTLSLLYTDSAGREAEVYLDGLRIGEDGKPERVAPYEAEGWTYPWE